MSRAFSPGWQNGWPFRPEEWGIPGFHTSEALPPGVAAGRLHGDVSWSHCLDLSSRWNFQPGMKKVRALAMPNRVMPIFGNRAIGIAHRNITIAWM